MYRAEVVRTWLDGPRMQRLEVRIDGGFSSNGVGDEFVRLHPPDRSGSVAAEISREDDTVRYYTIRAWDSASSVAQMCLVLHGHGPAARWGGTARPGARLLVSGQPGKYRRPDDAHRILLYGDVTALPATSRILEQVTGSRDLRLVCWRGSGDACGASSATARVADAAAPLPHDGLLARRQRALPREAQGPAGPGAGRA